MRPSTSFFASRLVRASILAACFGTPAFADAVFANILGNLTLTRFLTASGEVDDVRGAGVFSVTAPGLTGQVLYADSTNGTDPNFNPPLPFGSFLIFAANPALTQETLLAFDFNPSHFVFTPDGIIIDAFGSASDPIPTTDPILQTTLGPLAFTFTHSSSTTEGNGVFVDTYLFTSGATVPEPGSFTLAAFGIPALAAAFLLRRKPRPPV